jgi:hypothetical protein
MKIAFISYEYPPDTSYGGIAMLEPGRSAVRRT